MSEPKRGQTPGNNGDLEPGLFEVQRLRPASSIEELRQASVFVDSLIEHHEPDRVFLTLLENPNGADVAFKYFDRFCDLLPPERLVQILRMSSEHIDAFRKKFEKHPIEIKGLNPSGPKGFARHLQKLIFFADHSFLPLDASSLGMTEKDFIYAFRQLHDVIETGKTPWTFEGGGIFLDLWEVWMNSRHSLPYDMEILIRPDSLVIDDLLRGEISQILKDLPSFFHVSLRGAFRDRGEAKIICILTFSNADTGKVIKSVDIPCMIDPLEYFFK